MTLGSHQQTIGETQSWITPKWVIDALGLFDLDPCAASPRPWDCAVENWSSLGLNAEWFGRIWLNPPFERYQVGKWVRKLADHGNGMALLHARTEAEWFEPVWQRASGILFLADRLYFHYSDGRRAEANSGAPAVLCAFDGTKSNVSAGHNYLSLLNSKIQGYLVTSWLSR
jgi:hypothetical protein